MIGALRDEFRKFVEREAAGSDLSRGTRAAFAVAVPLALQTAGWLPLNITFVVFAAQSVAIVDVRGAYTLRLGVLLAMTAILVGASTLGGAVSTNLMASVLAAGFIAICGGLWRHVMPDYGAPLAISSTLLFLISVNAAPAATWIGHHGIGALVGGLWGVALQIANWPIRPQHPLRRAASDSWAAVADLFAALGVQDPAARGDQVRQAESALRTTLDQTYAALASSRPTPLRLKLEELNLSAARLATRVVALNTVLESLPAAPESESFSASLQPVLTSLTNTSRSVAVTVVSRQPAQLATCEVRVHRLANLLRAVVEPGAQPWLDPNGAAQLRSILKQIEQLLPQVLELLRSAVDRADERAAFSLELFDLDTWTLRPLASSIILDRKVDPALARFTARVAVMVMAGVAAFKHLNLPNGYWLPLTMVIVLQPDYGSTRQRAAQRVLGTLAGSILASLLLWLRLPLAALTATTAVTMFCFGFFIKRRYAVSVVFITLAVVLLTEAHGPVPVSFTVERLTTTLAGGVLALVAALLFWPVWERDRLRPILARAIEANRDFLRLIAARLVEGGAYDEPAVATKRHVETANSAVFSSLQRMMGDPRQRRDRLEQVAVYANGNQRITRTLIVMAVQLVSGRPVQAVPALQAAVRPLDRAFGQLAAHLRRLPAEEKVELALPPIHVPALVASADDAANREHWILLQLTRIATELRAMALATEPSHESPAPDESATLAPRKADPATPA